MATFYLAELLADPSWALVSARDLVELLAAVGDETELVAADRSRVAELAPDELATDAVERLLPEWLALTIPLEPSLVGADEGAWLASLGMLDRAIAGAGKLAASWAQQFEALGSAHAARAAGLRQQLTECSGDAVLDIARWTRGQLGAGASAEMRARVAREGAERDAYRASIAQRSACVPLGARDAGRMLDVAAGPDDDRVSGAVLLDLRLPHLDGDGLRVVRTLDGVRWSYAGRIWTTPCEPRTETWGDDVTGPLRTNLVVHPPEPADDAWDDVCVAWRLASGEGGARAESVGLAVARQLSGAVVREHVGRAAACFAQGDDPDEEDQRWVRYALGTRVALEAVARRTRSAALLDAVAAADATLAAAGAADAVWILADEAYESATCDQPLDADAWWGRRARVDALLGDSVLSDTLATAQGQLDDDDGASGTRNSQTRSREQVRAFSAGAPVLGVGERLLSTESPGQILVAFVRQTGDAGIGVLRVEHVDGGGFFEPRLGPIARDALWNAFHAVSRCTRSRGAPWAPEDHHISVELPDDIAGLDGPSLGLAAALALASLWTGKPVSGVTASAQVRKRDGSLDRVLYVQEKACALARIAGGSIKLLVCAGNEGSAQVDGIETIPVTDVRSALQAAELLESVATIEGTYLGDVSHRIHDLGDLVHAVEIQDLSTVRWSTEPWRTLAERIVLVLGSLEGAVQLDARLRIEARVRAALAFTHAGTPREELPKGLLPKREEDPATWAKLGPEHQALCLLPETIEAIDRDDWARCDELLRELAAVLPAIAGRASLPGQVVGTMGRVWMHRSDRRDLSHAESLFREALALMQPAAPHESGRSRLEIAHCLRMQGRLDEAAELLDQARWDYQAHTREFSRPYYESCLVFWHYERARLWLAMGEPERALADAERALDGCGPGWPRHGILRVLAWATRMMGNDDEAERYASDPAVVAKVPVPAIERIAREAREPFRPDGEVY